MSHSTRTARAATLSSLALAALVVLGGCAKSDTAADSAKAADSVAAAAAAATPAPAAVDSAKPAGALNDAQIAHVAVTANSIDSAAGAMAKQKGASQAVKDFGQTMITDHGGVNKQAVALATKLNVTPEDNDVSKSLKRAADASTANLNGKSGADFDKAYIDNEVTYHQNVLDALDKTLIPGAQNAELKTLLTNVRPAVAAHLDRAKGIRTTLNK